MNQYYMPNVTNLCHVSFHSCLIVTWILGELCVIGFIMLNPE